MIAPRLVLTAAHAVPGLAADVQVWRPGDATACAGTVVWRGAPGGRDDGALVYVDDPAWQPPTGKPVRWGRVVTDRPGIACRAWGFPALAQRLAGVADTWQPSGTLNPGNLYVADRYVFSLAGHPPAPAGDERSPWEGLSGAALFCGDLLAGVVTAEPAGGQHAYLEATPLYVLLHDAAFRTVLGRHGIADVVPEPIELQRLAEIEPPGAGSAAGLLRARQEVVEFRGRQDLLDKRMMPWTHGSGTAVWLLYGPAGQGKTRLAQELARRLSQDAGDRWASLWLSRNAPQEELTVLAAVAVPLLVIVDYAETRADQLTAALRAVAGRSDGHPLRILLLARTAGGWWSRLQAGDQQVEDLLDGTPVTLLAELEPLPEGRAEAYRQAVAGLASALPRIRGQQHHDWHAIAGRLDVPELGGLHLASALTMQMTALADLLDLADGLGPAGPSPETAPQGGGELVEDRLLRHEERYWWAAARAHGLLPALSEGTLQDALTAALLAGAEDPSTADVVLRRVPGLHDQPRDRRDSVRRWIADLYPPFAPGDRSSEDARPWGNLQPDRLAERFLATRLAATPGLADQLVPYISSAQAVQLLTFYARAAHHPVSRGRLNGHLTALCVRHAGSLAPVAIDVSAEVEAPEPLIDALRYVATDPSSTWQSLEALAGRLPPASYRLAEWAAELYQRLTEQYRALAANDPDGFRSKLATSLENQAVRLADLGRREDALAAITEAVTVYWQLAVARPDTFRPDLAGALNTLSNALASLGRREKSLAAVNQAVTIHRELNAAHPEVFRPGLAASLNNRAVRLTELGRRPDALTAIDEAVAEYRQLAVARPDAFRPYLASALNTLSRALADLGRRDDALVAIGEAVAIRRELTAARPDAFRPDLAGSLNGQALRLADLGRREEALAAIDEAVAEYRQLAAARPDAFGPCLAGSLNTLSRALTDVGRREEALAAINEAVAMYTALNRTRPDAFRRDLAGSLSRLSSTLADLGRREEALAAIHDAVTVYRKLAKRAASKLSRLRVEETPLGGQRAYAYYPWPPAGGQQASSRRPARRRSRRHLLTSQAFGPDLARSLEDQSLRLADAGRWADAQEAISEAIAIYRGLTRRWTESYIEDLERSLRTLVWIDRCGDETTEDG